MTVTPSARPIFLALLLALALGPIDASAQARPKGQVMAHYDPAMGVRVSSPDGAVQLTAPTGALDKPATFSHEAIDPPAPAGSFRMSRAFKLEAAGSDKKPIKKFARPLRLVVRYDDADLAALKVKPSALRLLFQDDASAWHVVPTTVDASGRTLRADVDHFTTFAAGTAAPTTRSTAPTARAGSARRPAVRNGGPTGRPGASVLMPAAPSRRPAATTTSGSTAARWPRTSP